MYRLYIQKSFILWSESNLASIEPFYSGQSFICLQSFIDLLLIPMIIYYIKCYIISKYIVNIDFIPSYFIHDIIWDIFIFTNFRHLSSSGIKIYNYVKEIFQHSCNLNLVVLLFSLFSWLRILFIGTNILHAFLKPILQYFLLGTSFFGALTVNTYNLAISFY